VKTPALKVEMEHWQTSESD